MFRSEVAVVKCCPHDSVHVKLSVQLNAMSVASDVHFTDCS